MVKIAKRTLSEEALHLAGLILAHTSQNGDLVRRGLLAREFRHRFRELPVPIGELRARQAVAYSKKYIKVTDRDYLLSLARWTLDEQLQ